MKKREKIWKIIAVCCIGVGIIVSVSAMAAVGFDFTKFSSTKYELETCVVEEPFENIEIQTDWQDIRLLPSETPECKVVYAGNETLTYTVKVESGTLKINTEEHREWYQYLSNFNFGDYTDVTLYLPEKDYQSLSISTSSGNVIVPESFSFASASLKANSGNLSLLAAVSGDLNAESSSGEIKVEGGASGNIHVQTGSGNLLLKQCSPESMQAVSSSGNVSATDIVAKQGIVIKTGSGEVNLSSSDASELTITTSSGSVRGSLRSGKRFIVNTSSGDVSVPDDPSASQQCRITTGSGDVSFSE